MQMRSFSPALSFPAASAEIVGAGQWYGANAAAPAAEPLSGAKGGGAGRSGARGPTATYWFGSSIGHIAKCLLLCGMAPALANAFLGAHLGHDLPREIAVTSVATAAFIVGDYFYHKKSSKDNQANQIPFQQRAAIQVGLSVAAFVALHTFAEDFTHGEWIEDGIRRLGHWSDDPPSTVLSLG